MSSTITYSDARARFAELLDRVEQGRKPVTITRQGHGDTVLISAEEFSSLVETAHLLSSPRNAARIFEALERRKQGKGTEMTIEQLRKRLGLSEE